MADAEAGSAPGCGWRLLVAVRDVTCSKWHKKRNNESHDNALRYKASKPHRIPLILGTESVVDFYLCPLQPSLHSRPARSV